MEFSTFTTHEAARTIRIVDFDLRHLAAGASTVVDLLPLIPGASVGVIKWKILETVATTDATATITATTLAIGDDDDADGYITAGSVLSDATPINFAQSNGAYCTVGGDVNPGIFKLYTAAKTLKATFAKTGAGNATARFLKGKIRFIIEVIDCE